MKKPLQVALLSISPHNRAILEFFFAGAGKQVFSTVPVEQAEAFIVDFDHPGARQEWQDYIAQDFKPAIVLSVKEAAEEKTIWVPKPLTSKALLGAAEDVRQFMVDNTATLNDQRQEQDDESHQQSLASLRALLDKQANDAQPFGVSRQNIRKAPPIAKPIPSVAVNESLVRTAVDNIPGLDESKNTDVPTEHAVIKNTENLTYSEEHHLRTEDVYIPPPLADDDIPEMDGSGLFQEDSPDEVDDDPIKLEQRYNRLCGQELEVSAANWQESNALYTAENYLLNRFVDALNLSHQSKQYVQVKIDTDDYALLMPDVNLAYCTIEPDSDAFVELCYTPLKTGRVQLHLPDTKELAALDEIVRGDAYHTYDMESLIWTTSLLTSRGRLNRNADLSQPLRLKHWPNMTRLEQFPHVMRIAAVWQQRAGTVFDVSGWLDIPQRYVIAFYNAAHTLSLFTVEQAKPQLKEKPAPKKNRGLFSRLLKRLLGGGAK